MPHSEIDLILVNGESVGFDYRLKNEDRVAVYPMFESIDISPLQRLRARPLRTTRFVVDVNLGKLARGLRMLGFDTLYDNQFGDREIVELSAAERRIILTRDRRLLFRKAVTHGFWVRSDDPDSQLREVISRLDLGALARPLRRCLECNGRIERVDRERIWDSLEPLTRRYYSEFYRCSNCQKVYWKGSHFEPMTEAIRRLIGSPAD